MPGTLWSAPVPNLGINSLVVSSFTTATKTDLSPSQVVLWPGMLNVGTRIRLKAFGVYTATTTASALTWGFYMNSTATNNIATTPAILAETASTAAGVLTPAPWDLEWDGQVRALTSPAVPAPRAAGLVCTAGAGAGGDSSHCWADSWSATPAAGGSQAVTSTGAGADDWGLAVWVWRGSGGIGNRATSTTSAKTVSLIRSGASPCVVFASGDFAAAATTGYSFTPAVANDRQHVQDAALYSAYVADFGDQGGAGTTSYGTSGETSAGPFTNLALEILGLAPAAAALPRQALAALPRLAPHRARLGARAALAAGILATGIGPPAVRAPHQPPAIAHPAPHRASRRASA